MAYQAIGHISATDFTDCTDFRRRVEVPVHFKGVLVGTHG